ncbi:hypothetical protein NQT62_02045 [Limnobacter humi]|uniref:Uncharacterized protein n=1 Tax=Limnobacter humi TaxID=1778671 RepID=A0ABT1WCI0_9BURK|nr:hypothetical protein [Limnobacter humi]MCQ8895218.1 hypothetical protein [Limnobacter humi]
MEAVMGFLVLGGPASLLLTVLTVLYTVVMLARQGYLLRGFQFVCVAGGLYVGAYLLGSMVGVFILCGVFDAGNLCGLGGYVGTGPCAACVVTVMHARRVLQVAESEGGLEEYAGK